MSTKSTAQALQAGSDDCCRHNTAICHRQTCTTDSTTDTCCQKNGCPSPLPPFRTAQGDCPSIDPKHLKMSVGDNRASSNIFEINTQGTYMSKACGNVHIWQTCEPPAPTPSRCLRTANTRSYWKVAGIKSSQQERLLHHSAQGGQSVRQNAKSVEQLKHGRKKRLQKWLIQ